MTVKFEFISAFLCERVLVEQDGVLSAIRIIDVFNLPETTGEPPEIQFFAVVALKTRPIPRTILSPKVTLVRVSGERVPMPDPPPFDLSALAGQDGDPSMPGGISFVMQLKIKVVNFGTAFVEIEVDQEVVVRIPFTMRRIPAVPQQQMEQRSLN